MIGKSGIVWTLKELRSLLMQRQRNKFDCNLGISGKRGDGKSTFIDKLLLPMPNFNQWKHQVYSRDDVINLLKNQKFSYCWDDEAINSGYKRDFQQTGQKELIKIITAYRDNFNMYAGAIPFFYSLDKDLRELIFMHIHIIERGWAVILLPLEDNLHQTDVWDTKNNARLEEKWQEKKKEKPDFRFPYHRLSTFAGYLFFNDVTSKQRELYEEIKRTKRKQGFQTEQEKKENMELNFYDNLFSLLIQKKISKEGLLQICLTNGKKYSTVTAQLNTMLRNVGIKETLSGYLVENVVTNKAQEDLNQLIPDV